MFENIGVAATDRLRHYSKKRAPVKCTVGGVIDGLNLISFWCHTIDSVLLLPSSSMEAEKMSCHCTR